MTPWSRRQIRYHPGPMATLADLVAVRSQRALRLKAHLDWVERGAAWPTPPWLSSGETRLDDVYVPPFVIPHDGTGGRLDRRMEERVALAPAERERDDRRVPWDEEWVHVRRAVILGRAGEGKSTVLRWTSREVARLSRAQWEARKVPLEQIPIPIVLKAEHIMRAGSVAAAISLACQPPAKPASGLRAPARWPVTDPEGGLTEDELLSALKVDTTWLFVDALDERPPEHEVPSGLATEALRTLGPEPADTRERVRARLLFSVRTYAWHENQHPLPFRVVRLESHRSGRDRDKRLPGDGIVVYDLAKLAESQRREVVKRWHPGDAHADRRRQLTELLDVAPMVELTNNALLLTLLCVAARDTDRKISRATRRAELYAWLVADFVARPDNAVVGLAHDGAVVQRRVGILARAAWGLWQITQGGEFSYQQWEAQVGRFVDPAKDDEVRLHAEVEAAGLLTVAGLYRSFFPQTLFEYLAGAGLVYEAAVGVNPSAVDEVAGYLVAHGEEDSWRELITLGIGHLAVVQRCRDVASTLVLRTLERSVALSNAGRGALAAVLGEAVVESGERDVRLPENLTGGPAEGAPVLSQAARDALSGVLFATMRNADAPGTPRHVPALVRTRAGTALGWIGDPRFDPHAFWLPAVAAEDPLGGFVLIQPGRFMMGSAADDPDGFDDERPLLEVSIKAPFFIGRWPVTVVEWAAYLLATRKEPEDPESLADPPTWPVRFVSVKEADAYCAWLTEQLAPRGNLAKSGAALATRLKAGTTGVRARLATEEEWEYVAKGGVAGRKYPYGPDFDADAANSEETGVGTPSAVGSFARGIAHGPRDETLAEDLSGNVWEWTSSPWRKDYLPGTAPDMSRRVLRGGAFHYNRWHVRAAYRSGFGPDFRNDYYGFRVVLCPFAPEPSDL